MYKILATNISHALTILARLSFKYHFLLQLFVILLAKIVDSVFILAIALVFVDLLVHSVKEVYSLFSPVC